MLSLKIKIITKFSKGLTRLIVVQKFLNRDKNTHIVKSCIMQTMYGQTHKIQQLLSN